MVFSTALMYTVAAVGAVAASPASASIVGFSSAGSTSRGSRAAPRPHIISIFQDDLGYYDSGIHNPAAAAWTQNITDLAKEGIVLEYVFFGSFASSCKGCRCCTNVGLLLWVCSIDSFLPGVLSSFFISDGMAVCSSENQKIDDSIPCLGYICMYMDGMSWQVPLHPLALFTNAEIFPDGAAPCSSWRTAESQR